MANLNTFEFGQVVRADIKQDVSSNTGLTFMLQPKEGRPKNANASLDEPRNAVVRTQADGVVVGTANVVVGDETFLANQYLEYTLKQDDLSIPGIWRFKGEAQLSSTVRAVGDYRSVTVSTNHTL